MSEPPGLRISDEERERAAAEIRDHFAAGRLDPDELSERLEGVYRARTEHEVQALRADLPPLPASVAQRQTELATRRAALRRELVQHTGGALVPFVICTVIWAAAGSVGRLLAGLGGAGGADPAPAQWLASLRARVAARPR